MNQCDLVEGEFSKYFAVCYYDLLISGLAKKPLGSCTCSIKLQPFHPKM